MEVSIVIVDDAIVGVFATKELAEEAGGDSETIEVWEVSTTAGM